MMTTPLNRGKRRFKRLHCALVKRLEIGCLVGYFGYASSNRRCQPWPPIPPCRTCATQTTSHQGAKNSHPQPSKLIGHAFHRPPPCLRGLLIVVITSALEGGQAEACSTPHKARTPTCHNAPASFKAKISYRCLRHMTRPAQ